MKNNVRVISKYQIAYDNKLYKSGQELEVPMEYYERFKKDFILSAPRSFKPTALDKSVKTLETKVMTTTGLKTKKAPLPRRRKRK